MQGAMQLGYPLNLDPKQAFFAEKVADLSCIRRPSTYLS